MHRVDRTVQDHEEFNRTSILSKVLENPKL